ncbi:MAG: tetratricopeptide repeat protein [Hymenobacter sp.]|nr:MAG: tetratricopeptide repeat protein [Hymenobacter sp.]
MPFRRLLFCLLLPFLSWGQTPVEDLLEQGFQERGRKAIRLFTRAIRQDSTSAKAYWRRGDEYYRLKKYPLALADLNKSLQVDSAFSYGQVIADRGQTHEMMGNYAAAIRDFTRAIAYAAAKDPDLPQGLEQYYYHRGRTNLKDRDTTCALLDLASALRYYPKHYEARTLRARVYCRQGKYQAALAEYAYLFEKAYPGLDLRLEAESAADFYYRGRAKQQVGDSTWRRDSAIAKRFHYYPGKPIYQKGPGGY